MKNNFLKIVLFILCSILITSCLQKSEDKKEIVFWTDMTETEALQKIAARFEKKEGFAVRIVRVPFEELKPKYQVASPVRKGPDVITGPHDWVGPFATAELISPIKLSETEKEQFLPVTLKTLSFNGNLCGLPISLETLGLIYNKKFIKSPPQTMEELIVISTHANDKRIEELRGKTSQAGNTYDSMLNYEAFEHEKKSNTDPGKSLTGFLYEIEDFYFSWSFLGGYGAYIFKENSKGTNLEDIGLNSKEALEGLRFITELRHKYRLIPQGMTKDIANGRFMENTLLFTINGPWALVDYKNRQVDYGFAPLPILENGKRPAPFVGVQGIYLNNYSDKKEIALKFMKELCSLEGEIDIYQNGARVPSRFDAQKDDRVSQKITIEPFYGGVSEFSFMLDISISDNNDVKGILESAKNGTPMPNIPELGTIWTPMKEAIQLVLMGKQESREALDAAVKRIHGDVKRMKN